MRRLANSKPATRNSPLATIKFLIVLIYSILFPNLLSAQEQIPMADTMRSEGKIYVVVAIALVILVGLLVYLFMIDKKISKLEKNSH